MDVAVLGAGRRGRGIAARCAVSGHSVSLRDEDANRVMDTVDAIERDHGAAVGERVTGTTGLEAAVGGAAVVIEATDDSVADKRDRVAAVEEFVEEATLIAADQPNLSVTAVAAGLRNPSRAIGLHFVDPAADPLVEIVVADQTTTDSLERARSFVDELDCESLVVGDTPGFVTDRLDLAMIVEAAGMVDARVASVRDVDRSMTVARKHPQGPLELADEIGLDRVVQRLEDLADRLDGRFAPPGILHEKVAAGSTGKRAGEGFYVWENGEPAEPAAPKPTVQTREQRTDGPGR